MGKEAFPLLCALALLLFAPPASAELSVVLQPLGDANEPLYQMEVRYYKLSVLNISNSDLSNVEVVVAAPPEIALLSKGSERRELFFTFLSLSPGFAQQKTFEVKGISETAEPAQLRADFSEGGAMKSSSVPVEVVKPPVEVSAALAKGSLKPRESSSVSFEITNSSQENVSNLSVELFSSNDAVVEGATFEKGALAPGEKVSGDIPFSLGESTGKVLLLLRVFFDDQRGTHVLEKSFPLEVGNRDVYVMLLIAGIILLVVLYIYKKRVEGGIEKEDDNGGDAGEPKKPKWAAHGEHH